MTYRYCRFLPGLLLGLISVMPLAGDRCGAEEEEEFDPYHVYVDQEGVTARCGPGGEYYRTDPLRHGQRLEVYLETADGWLGVRPPEGSFCWVPADAVTLDRGEAAGKVTEDATLAWIGTHLGKARKYLWQIQLARGEHVTILGRAEREGPDGPQLWYRIVPPSGEFRWVHRDQVVDNPEMLLREKPQNDERIAAAAPTPLDPFAQDVAVQASSRQQRGEAKQSVLQGQPLAESPGSQRPGGEAVRLHALDAAGAVPLSIAAAPGGGAEQSVGPASYSPMPAPGAPASQSFAPASQDAYPGPPATGDRPVGSGVSHQGQPPLMSISSQPILNSIGATGSEASAVSSAESSWTLGSSRVDSNTQAASESNAVRQVDHQLPYAGSGGGYPASTSVDALQLELTRRMVASARAAELEPLRLAAEEIARSHALDTERQRAGLLAQRVQQVQAVARRRDGENEPRAAAGSPAAISVQAAGPAAAAGPSEVTGYLVQVYSARPDSPPFALTDASGRTTHYVSPAPGLNLRRFLNQHITVGGQAGYQTGLDTPHIIASGAVRSPELR